MKAILACFTLTIPALSAEITWPENQALPWFTEPADELDAVSVAGLSADTCLTLFISDGDNIQYNQHAMRRVWDEQKAFRGRVPLNWTISPALVDIAPGILNYYYRTATPLDCFVAGPSGLGYLMPVHTLREPGAEIGPTLTDPARTLAFARLTESYLKRSGLRIITIWDNASPLHRKILAGHCPSLLGAIVQNFKDMPSVKSSIENGLAFEKLVVPYTTTAEHLTRSITRELQRRKDGKKNYPFHEIA